MKQIPYAAQWIEEDDIAAVADALGSEYLTQGPLVKKFEEKIADYCGARFAVAVNSGTSALHAACFAAGLSSGDEVITSPITFVASANAVLYCGARPVFTDIEKEHINIDPEEISKSITGKTKAILPVHFAGHPCKLKEIRVIADKHKLFVIEDAAHALGAQYEGQKIGSCAYSDMTVLSFHAIKHITTGEGGMVLTNNEELYQKLMMFRSHGITREHDRLMNKENGSWYYEMQMLGYNFRITDFQSALGIKQLGKLDRFISRRRELAGYYTKALSSLPGLVLPKEDPAVKSAWHIYPIRVRKNRRIIFDNLRNAGIGVNVHYLPVYLQPFYQKLGYPRGLCPRAEAYYETAITLPLYPKMTDKEIDQVIKRVAEEVGNNG